MRTTDTQQQCREGLACDRSEPVAYNYDMARLWATDAAVMVVDRWKNLVGYSSEFIKAKNK